MFLGSEQPGMFGCVEGLSRVTVPGSAGKGKEEDWDVGRVLRVAYFVPFQL